MDDLHNPYHPGASARPPELAGRDDLIRDIQLAIQRVQQAEGALDDGFSAFATIA